MVQYLYALTENEKTVSANLLKGKVLTGAKYTCLGCGNELIARVNGKVVAPHFAHKVKQECSGETYLHKLGKWTFYQTYKQCLESETPFYIELEQTKVCTKYQSLIMKDCQLGQVTKQYDLTQYYSEVLLEKKDTNFIPDVLLRSAKNPDEKIYIEIAVTHFLSEAKEYSGNRIIEIPMNDEADTDKITGALISKDTAMFIGFNEATTAISDSECSCNTKKGYAFYIFEGGKCFLDYSTLSQIKYKLHSIKKSVSYINITLDPPENFSRSPYEIEHKDGGQFFHKQLELAKDRGIPVKNCFLCRYSGKNYSEFQQGGVFCKWKKQTFNSNYAVNCEGFKYK